MTHTPQTDSSAGQPTSEELLSLERRLNGRIDRLRATRDGWTTAVYGVAVIALLASLLGAALAIGNAGDGDGGAAAAATGETMTIDVELGDLFVRPSEVEVAAGTELIVRVTNNGELAHDLKLDGETGTDMLDPGESQEVSLGVITDTAEAWCTVPGHREAGMSLDIVVTGGGDGSAGGAGGDDRGDRAEIDFAAEIADDFQPYDPTLQPAPGGTEHEITLHATETVIEVSPGVTQELWTFNDLVPGPVLRGRVGDIFTVTLVNDGTIGHSIDFHASRVAWDDEMRTIEPGESLVYQFTAEHAGIWMYHCGTAPVLHHIGNGMFGAIIIDPPNLPPVDREYVFVQSEYYLGPDGEPGDLGAMLAEDHDAVVFNGYVNQYLHRPIEVEPGERIRAWVLDAGPSENSSFHIVGTIFDTVYEEGRLVLQPDATSGGSQALDLQPAQGGYVEFSFAENGLYPIVTHKFAAASIGALGFFQAGEPRGEAGGH